MRTALLTALLPLALARAPLHVPDSEAQIIKGKYIIKFKDASIARAAAADAADGDTRDANESLRSLSRGADEVFTGPFHGFSSSNLDDVAIETLRDNPDVEFIEHDAIFNAQAYTTQPSAPWGLVRISHRQRYDGTETSYAYDSSAGVGTCAYVIDTGIDASHPDFGGRASQVADFSNSGGSGTDGNGHGTHLAGIIGGSTYGVAKKTKLLGVKVLSDNGSGTTSAVIQGMNFVATDKATRGCPAGAAANIAIGGSFSASVNAAAKALVNAGVFVGVAAGNQGTSVGNYSPASEPLVCTVGASDKADSVANISNFGPGLDIFAPGRDIPSTWIGGGVQTLSGTSTASAHVTGLGVYLAALEGITNGALICGRIQQLATQGVLTGVPAGTVNLLAFNGNPSG